MQLITAKHLLTMDSDPISDGAIVVEEGKIIEVGKKEDLASQYPKATRHDYSNHVLMPGLINAHSHLEMSAHKNYPFDPVRSMAIEVNFIEWLIGCIEYKKTNSPDKFREAIQKGVEASIESGTTCVGDMGSFEGIFEILKDRGLRAVVFPELITYDSEVAQDLYQTALALVEKYENFDSGLITMGLAPYAPYTLSRNILKITAEYCGSCELPLMLHTAESFSELEFFYNSSGDIATRYFNYTGWGENLPPNFQKTPVEYLEGIGFLKAMPILVGCVHATQADIDRIGKAKAKVVLSPRANHYLQIGEAPLVLMHQRGIDIALGTDGIASTNTLSLWDELRFVQERLSHKESNPITGKDLLNMVTRNSAKVLGLEESVGTLTKGKKADYIVIDASDIPSSGDLFSELIKTTKTYHIQKVVVSGKVLKSSN